MDSILAQTLEQDGYAQVLVELTNLVDLGAAAAAVQHDIEGLFLDPSVIGDRPAGAVLASELGAGLAANAPVHLVRAAPGTQTPPRVRLFPTLGLALGYVDRAGAEALAHSPAIARMLLAEVPSLVRPVEVQRVAATVGPSWGVTRIGAPTLWNQGIRGAGVLVGHVDTGVDASHPALGAQAIADFAEFDLNGMQAPGVKPWDSDEHGTHTAGTILGRPGAHGAFGVAPEARLLSAMVIEGGNVIARILAGMDWAAQQGAQIMNASLGLRGQSPVFQMLVKALRARNILPVFAVGNEGPATSRYPGNYATVLSVGASDHEDRVPAFSGSQRFLNPDRMVPDLVAPGDRIVSCTPNGGFAMMSGTSMATPHIAGLAALLLSDQPGASIDDLEQAIEHSCQLPATMQPQRANRGVPDGPRALALLRKQLGVPTAQLAGRPRHDRRSKTVT